MKKLKALMFLFKCTGYIAIRIMRGMTWNMLICNMEEPEGRRQIKYYRQGDGSYSLSSYYLERQKQN